MNTEIKKNIYAARCIGNVEPIEYMIPYPSMRSLIEGQNIKYSQQLIIEEPNLTNFDFYTLVQQTANWLEKKGLKPKERIILPKLNYPQTEILLYGIWQLGGIGVLCKTSDTNEISQRVKASPIINNQIDLYKTIKKFPKVYNPKYKPLLDDEALITFEKKNGIKLSHYNLLVNAYGIQKSIGIRSRTRYHCNLSPGSAIWVVFKVILPIFCGCIFDSKDPELTIGEIGCTYTLRSDLENIEKFSDNDIAICTENTAALTIGRKTLHLSQFFKRDNLIDLTGHSVTIGYTDDSLNELRFINGRLTIPV